GDAGGEAGQVADLPDGAARKERRGRRGGRMRGSGGGGHDVPPGCSDSPFTRRSSDIRVSRHRPRPDIGAQPARRVTLDAAVFGKLAAEGLRTIDPADPGHVEQYDLDDLTA